MKNVRVILILVMLFMFASNKSEGQALVQKDFNWLLITPGPRYYSPVDMMAVFTPSGNILHKQEFLLDPDDSLVPEKGVKKVKFKTMFWHNGTYYVLYDAEGLVYADGRCNIIFHLNGAGDSTPLNKQINKN